jgi:hypothetical protein
MNIPLIWQPFLNSSDELFGNPEWLLCHIPWASLKKKLLFQESSVLFFRLHTYLSGVKQLQQLEVDPIV